ncbi:synaptojanin-1-like [Actinia tenebrosa]|uniref:phosphoinositide 5-phosphatase n=1 Tax=Actinia tenebrosa TaxID=6105 RepID=A0A6P8H0K6_ACTTE|nr:synaptojanin-1-like [Actinia tenebrosa]
MLIGKSFTCYTKTDKDPVSILLECKHRTETLLFESGAIAQLSQLETETIKKNYTKVVDAYGCLGVLKINLDEEETIYFLVLVTGCTSVGKIQESEIFKINATHFVPLQEGQDDESITEIRKLLNSSNFYFAVSQGEQLPLDLSLSAQRQHDKQKSDNRFMWNRSLQVHVEKFGVNCSHWLLSIMCGGVEIKTVYIGAKQAKACLISRLSCERAGTRFYVRGTNDEGHVANFVETEQLIVLDQTITSYVQTRGSVPVFWEQPGLQFGSHKVKLSRGFIASSPAFDRHITALKSLYGQNLIVNLLGIKEGENTLSTAFQDQLKDSVHGHNTPMICFDYHRICKGGRASKLAALKDKAKPSMDEFGLFFAKAGKVEKRQKGVIRSNCLDCIDRSNNVQTFFGFEMLAVQMQCLGLANKASIVARFEEAFKVMWQKNGDNISRIYIGTGALDGKARVVNKLRDGARSVKRAIRSNFLDGSKQEAIDMLLLGNTFSGELGERARALLNPSFLHSSPKILRELCDRHLEYTTWSHIRVCVGTWNVNGGRHFRSIAHKHQTMHGWLLDFHESLPDSGYSEVDKVDFKQPTDVYAIGFEELVDLNASNIVSTSSTQRKEWGEELRRVISRDFPYVLVTCEQLVGVCLYLFVRPHLVPYIRDVAVHAVKTGMGGSAGNKGGVAIRMLLHATSLCFVCSHLAAGQSGVQDRNNDYQDIASRIAFPMGRTIRSHDYVFWCGDFNYRIDQPIDDVKSFIKQKNWDALIEGDQLIKQRNDHKVFRGYHEGKLNFAPTYKYDLFSDDYDTSEKMRIPAWTDRVLWRRRKPRYKSEAHVKKHMINRTNEQTGDLMTNEGEEELEEDEDEDEEEENRDVQTSETDGQSSTDIHFHPGKVLYYGKAELKTSDHRPVVALIEVEIQEVDFNKQSKVHESVMMSMGPADPTIVVTCDDQDDEEGIDIEELLELLESFGTAVLVRVVDDEILVSFDDGRSALKALHLDGKQIAGKTALIRLKSESLLSNTDLTIHSLITSDSSLTGDSADTAILPQPRGRALSDLLSSTSETSTNLPILEPIKIQSAEGDSSESEAEEDIDYDEYNSDDEDNNIDTRPEADRDIEDDEPRPRSKPPRPAQPKRPPPPRPAAKPKPTQHQVSRIIEEPERAVLPEDDFKGSQETFEDFDPLAARDAEKASEKPRRPPPPRRPAPPKIKPKVTEVTHTTVDRSKPAKQASGPGHAEIGMPFNVQHLGHVSVDNIEALLMAAKDDPTLLPSFLAAEEKALGSDSQKVESKPKLEINSKPKDFLEPVKESSHVSAVNTSPETTHTENPPVPARRSRPTPIPRSRSFAESKEAVDWEKFPEPTAHAPPVVKPKPKTKPKPLITKSHSQAIENNSREVDDKTEGIRPPPYTSPLPPARPAQEVTSSKETLESNLTAPVPPARRRHLPKLPPTRPVSVPNLPQYVSQDTQSDRLDPDDGACAKKAGSIHDIDRFGESSRSQIITKKAGPPPVPPRVDLE